MLVQLFERRVLTYTPSNPAGFQVEMGNVGQHYYRWRYQSTPANSTSKLYAVTMTITPSSYTGLCPVSLKTRSYLKAGGVGKFYWSEYDSYFGISPLYLETLMLDGGYEETGLEGSLTIRQTSSGWTTVVVYEPKEVLSNRAEYTVHCQ